MRTVYEYRYKLKSLLIKGTLKNLNWFPEKGSLVICFVSSGSKGLWAWQWTCWVCVIESLFACFSSAKLKQKNYLIRFCCCYRMSTLCSLTFFMWLFRWADHFKTTLRLALKSWILLLEWRSLAHHEMLQSFWDIHTELENAEEHL